MSSRNRDYSKVLRWLKSVFGKMASFTTGPGRATWAKLVEGSRRPGYCRLCHIKPVSYAAAAPFQRTRAASTTANNNSTFCPYKTLGLSKDAASSQIKKAYYKHVFDLHPDRQVGATLDSETPTSSSRSSSRPSTSQRGRSPQQSEQFLRVVRAYEILRDPRKRREWDTAGRFATSSAPFSSTRHPFETGASRPYPKEYGWQHQEWADVYASSYPNVGRNTGPIYMSNGKMAGMIVVAAIVSGIIVFLHVSNVRAKLKQQWDTQDASLREYYDNRLQRAKEVGMAGHLQHWRERAAEAELQEKDWPRHFSEPERQRGGGKTDGRGATSPKGQE